MDADTLAHIFEPFFTTKETGKGTGLGLATVYGVVKQSGGHTAASSRPGAGSTFTIHFPRAQPEPEATDAAPDLAQAASGSETILLVEDEPALRRMAARILGNGGCTVLEAPNGAEALRICEDRGDEIALLLTDLVMPEMGGQELAAELAHRLPHVRVLYMSGYPQGAILSDGSPVPNARWVQKPFSADHLLQRIRAELDARRS